MPNMKICRKLEIEQRHTLAQCLGCSYLTGRLFKIYDILCMVLSNFDVDKRHDKWVTPLGWVFKIHDFFCTIFDRFIKIFHAPASPLTG